MITIINDGADIRSTNYWTLEHALHGFCFLTRNAGVWRLLVPAAATQYLDDMRTGSRALIERSHQLPGGWDVVFDDGTDAPFALTIDRRQVDLPMQAGEFRLTVWTEAGRVLDLPCTVHL